MSVSAKAIVLGLLTAVAGLAVSIMPPTAGLETSLGLDWLFSLRGSRPAPAEVVIVSIDRESSDRLDLPNDPEKWPRSLHARLVRNLASQGAKVIVFDIIFAEARDKAQDRLFAEAIREAGNVVLFEYLKKDDRILPDIDATPATQISIERRLPPIPELARSAAALAPFPLPKVPIKVHQFWLFKRGAGDVPTLPVVALHVYGVPLYQDLMRLLYAEMRQEDELLEDISALSKSDATRFIRTLRQLFQTYPDLVPRLVTRLQNDTLSHNRSVLRALIQIYGGEDSRYLDFYGPPRSVTTVPYYRVLEERTDAYEIRPTIDFQGKAVFVGFSEQLQPEQKDGFYTVFSQPDGVDLSGVEIAATAFANLLEGRSVEPLASHYHLMMIALWGMVLGALCLLLPPASLIPVATALGAAYTGAAFYAFSNNALWLPLVAPLLFQLPLALLGGLLWRYLDSRRERQKIHDAFSHYLPGQVVDELIGSHEDLSTKGQLVYGICLSTDAEQYTALSETLEPDALRFLLNSYYQTLFEPVRRRGGFISDVIGDAMLALWVAPTPDRVLREQACRAALDIMAATGDDNRCPTRGCLPTRIGLHCGEMVLGNVGAGDHYEYRAVGDIVNTATRIEGLNKQLGTRVLTSRELIEGLDGIISREIGSFRLVGKSRPLAIYELGCSTEVMDALRQDLYQYFAAGLRTFREERWQEAADIFKAILARYGDDGPSRYYLRLCEQYTRQPPASWEGVICLGQK